MRQSGLYLFYSDFNCPYCYALNERLMAVGDRGRVQWRGIEHLPGADSSDQSWDVQVPLNNEVSVVRRRAPEIPIITPRFRPNTRVLNQVFATIARTQPALQVAELRAALYRAYWRDERDISDLAVIASVVDDCGLDMPAAWNDPEVLEDLTRYQAQWTGRRFASRLPALLSERADKPLLGFPTLDFLYAFFDDGTLPSLPDGFDACQLPPHQHILVVGDPDESLVELCELAPAYRIHRAPRVEQAEAWVLDSGLEADLVVIDVRSTGQAGLDLCAALRRADRHRHVALIALVDEPGSADELAAFDVGATDVVFDLSRPKTCQARLEMHLRMRRNAALLGAMARFDFLTELPNRRELDRRLEVEWNRARRTQEHLSVCMVDIDHFKAYNDTLGHGAGDDCLRRVAAVLRKAARRATDTVARYGGEEFAVILSGTDLDGACSRARFICEAVQAAALPHPASPVGPVVTVSVGVASAVPTRVGGPAVMLEAADRALYEAKQRGRNRHVCGGMVDLVELG